MTCNKAKHAAEKGADEVTSVIDNLKEKGQDFLDEAKGRACDLADDAQSYGKSAWSDAKSWVKKNPSAAVGCALAAGFLLSLLGRPKRDD